MSPTPEIRGWCPTALHPMESGDGLLIRPKIIGARIGADQLASIAKIAKTCGNGLIDHSQRAQFQIRGINPLTLNDALEGLETARLLAANANSERITNILAPPLSGLDTSAIFDANRVVRDLAEGLSQDTELHTLPSKFLFAVEDGGKIPIDVSEADISIRPAEQGCLAVCLPGIEDAAVIVSREKAVTSALRLAKAFIELRSINPFDFRRMRKLINLSGIKLLGDKAGVSFSRFIPNPARQKVDDLGVHNVGDYAYAGVAAPSGRWLAEDLARLADLTVTHGLQEARLTPSRAILLPTPDWSSAEKIHAQAIAMGLIAKHNDPRRSVVACPGAPECLQGQGETRKYLERLAPFARLNAGGDGIGLHISGCSKGCARQNSTPVTLLLNRGSFDLVLNGVAQDTPMQTHLTIEEVERLLTNISRMKTPCRAI